MATLNDAELLQFLMPVLLFRFVDFALLIQSRVVLVDLFYGRGISI
jgi:hypothetical protein